MWHRNVRRLKSLQIRILLPKRRWEMFTRKTGIVWLGIILISGIFLMGQESWAPANECPTGAYRDHTSYFNLHTISGVVSGDVPSPGSCSMDYIISGTSDGTTLTFRAESEDLGYCCTILDFTLTANEDCTVLEGSVTYPPESSCSDGDGKWVRLTNPSQLQSSVADSYDSSIFLP